MMPLAFDYLDQAKHYVILSIVQEKLTSLGCLIGLELEVPKPGTNAIPDLLPLEALNPPRLVTPF